MTMGSRRQNVVEATTAMRFVPALVLVAFGMLVLPLPLWAQWAPCATNTCLATGNAGIGTPTPAEKLDVLGNMQATGFLRSNSANGLVVGELANVRRLKSNGTDFWFMTDANSRGTLGVTSALVDLRSDATTITGSANLATTSGSVNIGAVSGPFMINVGGRQLMGFNQGGAAVGGNIIGGMGFWGAGVGHGQFHYRVGAGFEFLNVTDVGPSITHASDAYAPLRAGRITSQGFSPDDVTPNLGSVIELANRGAGGLPYYWRTYTAPIAGGSGVTPNGYEIWEYPQDGTPGCCLPRLKILESGSKITSPSQVIIDGSGNLGLGTSTPVSKLHVVGDVTVTGNISAKYQDLAEWVPSKRVFPAGTVLVLDTDRTNHVQESSAPYDTHVAGVVSDQPGIILGEAGDDKLKVATTGRVKVKVDATSKPIRIGDLLVTGNKPGMAVASEPMEINGRKFHQPGTILGKALEPLASGEGEILVLLSLQ